MPPLDPVVSISCSITLRFCDEALEFLVPSTVVFFSITMSITDVVVEFFFRVEFLESIPRLVCRLPPHIPIDLTESKLQAPSLHPLPLSPCFPSIPPIAINTITAAKTEKATNVAFPSVIAIPPSIHLPSPSSLLPFYPSSFPSNLPSSYPSLRSTFHS